MTCSQNGLNSPLIILGSIIESKTGSGKKLLLHALAGEAELLAGKILLLKVMH